MDTQPAHRRPFDLPHRISLDNIARAARSIDPVFLDSPQLALAPLSQAVGCRLTIKVETLNPVRSFKGRGADFLVAGRAAAGLRTALVCASAGNFGQAMAYACGRQDIELTVFAAVDANAYKIARMRALGATVRQVGHDFDAAKAAARAWAGAHGQDFIEDGADVAITEGAGSLAVELLARSGRLDTVMLPLGNGALLAGVARWVRHQSPGTRIVGVTSRGAPAMALAWRAGPGKQLPLHPTPRTIADGIAVREPVPEALDDLWGLVDEVREVDDANLVTAMRLVHEHAGLVVEPAGVAGIAALVAENGAFQGLSVATVLCGAGLTRRQIRDYLYPEPETGAVA